MRAVIVEEMPHDAPQSAQHFEAWRAELLATSEIVQDDDESVPREEAEARFNRYIELAGDVAGDAPDEVFLTLYESLRDLEDYGAYETVLGALARAEPRRRGRLASEAVPALLRRAPDMAGDVLGQLASDPEAVAGFNEACAARGATPEIEELARYIADQERDGWLSGEARRGRLRPLPNSLRPAQFPDGAEAPCPVAGRDAPGRRSSTTGEGGAPPAVRRPAR